MEGHGKPLAICLMGPTASGKTELAIALSRQLPCDLISVDSAQVYRGLDIGTAKPSPQLLAEVPHRLIDIVDPADRYSAGRFRSDALRAMEESAARGRLPLLVGGTMLYFDALRRGLAELPPANPALRARLSDEAERDGWPALHARLAAVDPAAAAAIHPNDPQRIQRALEVQLQTGRPLSALRQEAPSPASKWRFISLIVAPDDRPLLHRRIAARFDRMLASGFVDEVRALRERADLARDLPSMRAVGYRQCWDYLDGRCDRETFREHAVIATRQLAKRQFTWLRREQSACRLDSDDPRRFDRARAAIDRAQ